MSTLITVIIQAIIGIIAVFEVSTGNNSGAMISVGMLIFLELTTIKEILRDK